MTEVEAGPRISSSANITLDVYALDTQLRSFHLLWALLCTLCEVILQWLTPSRVDETTSIVSKAPLAVLGVAFSDDHDIRGQITRGPSARVHQD
jgi:hypothetical protein